LAENAKLRLDKEGLSCSDDAGIRSSDSRQVRLLWNKLQRDGLDFLYHSDSPASFSAWTQYLESSECYMMNQRLGIWKSDSRQALAPFNIDTA
jgi:hypothetical protein